MARLPTNLALAALAARVGPVDRGLADPAGLAEAAGTRARAGPADRDPGAKDQVDLVGPVALAGLADIKDLADPVVKDRADQVGPADLGDRDMDRAGLVARDLADQVDPADPAARLGRRRRRSRPRVLSTAAAPRWVAPPTRRTASARLATVRRRHRYNTDSAGTMGLRQEYRLVTGTDRHPQAGGTARRPPAVGTVGGTGRRAAT